ncbi:MULTISPECIES: hypothetical protein [unclassified Chryseobacterium]|uniref:hypothetical protein n=1 Tax=unclassified Chryseobacterium TaxID=2593645 RepID=UPI00226A6D14|nr:MULTISPECIES: hypothetical protein [unclassified Chryseobacterium]
MESIFTLRALISISFLLFCLPFLRTCSNASIQRQNPVPEEIFSKNAGSVDSTLLQKALDERNKNIQQYEENYTFSFYKLLDKTFINNSKELDSSVFSDSTFYPLLCLLLVFVSTVFMLILAFFKRINFVKTLGIINISLLIICLIVFYAIDTIDSFSQIKIGFYLVFINFCLIIMISNKIQKLTQSTL